MSTRTAILAMTLALACGPSPDPEAMTGDATTAAATTAGETTGATPTTGSATTTAGASTTTGATTTTGDATTTSTTDAPATTAATSTGDETTTLAETTAGAPVTTMAWFVDGNAVQVRIFQGDPATDLCSVVFLDLLNGPGVDDPKYAAIERPDGWGVSDIWVYQDVDQCFDPYLWFRNPLAQADGATGQIVFHDVAADTQKPATLDIDVTASFAGDDPWVPAELPTAALAVPVDVG